MSSSEQILLDPCDEYLLALDALTWKVYRFGSGLHYATAKQFGQTVYLHRVICGLKRGDPREVDHLDGNGLNNRRENLRVVTHAQNQQNQHKQRRNISWCKARSRWEVQVKGSGTRKAGYFKTLEEAEAKAAEWRSQLLPFAVAGAGGGVVGARGGAASRA